MAEPFHHNMPVDPLIGTLPETLRHYPRALCAHAHPILSFAGVKANNALNAQTIYNPFAPIGALADQDGWVLLLGVDHTVNTSIHYAEKLAGRRRFVRWGLTKKRVIECPEFPGCSDGFEAIRPGYRAYYAPGGSWGELHRSHPAASNAAGCGSQYKKETHWLCSASGMNANAVMRCVW